MRQHSVSSFLRLVVVLAALTLAFAPIGATEVDVKADPKEAETAKKKDGGAETKEKAEADDEVKCAPGTFNTIEDIYAAAAQALQAKPEQQAAETPAIQWHAVPKQDDDEDKGKDTGNNKSKGDEKP